MRKFAFITFLAIVGGSLYAEQRYPALKTCASNPEALCGAIEVPETRGAKETRRLTLDVMVFPARSSAPAPDAVVALTGGGPGIASLPEAKGWVESYSDLHESRDIVFWDQRGTGVSNALDCEMGAASLRAFFGGEIDVPTIIKCRDDLERKADLRAYTHTDSADDLEDIRKWLGLTKINLYGSSSTSRLALVYAQRYPRNVRTLAVKAATPVAAKNPLYAARESQASLDRLFADCAADAKCAAAYPDVRSDFAAVLQSLAAAPAKAGDIEVTKDIFAGVIRRFLYGADTQAMIPAVISAAKHGNFAAVQPMLAAAPRIDRILNLGDFLSVTCSEDVAFYTDRDIEGATRATFTGDVLAKGLKRACGEWPAARLRHDYNRRVKNVPAIVISGTLDPDMPPVWGREMARLLPGSRHFEVEGIAHTGTPPCVRGIVTAFIVKGSSAELPTDCLKEMKRPAFR
jgi:pimeloyl-ACP methyl ester carboxylesterase